MDGWADTLVFIGWLALVWCSAWLVFYLSDVLLVWCSTCLVFYLTGVLLVWCSTWLMVYLSDVLLDGCSACLMFCWFGVLLISVSTSSRGHWKSLVTFTFQRSMPFFPLFQSISFSGGNRRYVQTSIPNGYGLTVFGRYVFWIDQNTKNVSYCLLDWPEHRERK